MNIVISQPMLFPWIGMLEQVRLADCYVDYADVQFSKGSFVNRVQVKTGAGPRWMTVPLRGLSLGQRIDEVAIDDSLPWRENHLQLLCAAYDGAPYRGEMLALVEDVYAREYTSVSTLSLASLMALCRYYGLDRERTFVPSSQLGIEGASSQRVLEIVLRLGGDRYITGHGARNYLAHEIFDKAGVRVEYMDYLKVPYTQLHGEFTPYVSALDLIANKGPDGVEYIRSGARYWKDFLDER
ncbi:WbqC family protein [Lysobacter sp. Root494]|uniref:WbqC family protein n=1 Tax=Lysobacter sp. Root494 TaxID=1736549 RepID=UPI0006FB48F5|nr:WbqC family protein [Lysobacter sp. Root494]KQY49729.1 hypothetical protein ASD14_13450 [Lysobacter sp. Root494]